MNGPFNDVNRNELTFGNKNSGGNNFQDRTTFTVDIQDYPQRTDIQDYPQRTDIQDYPQRTVRNVDCPFPFIHGSRLLLTCFILSQINK